MTKQEKNQVIEELTETLTASNVFYVTDTSSLNAEHTSRLRRACFNQKIQLRVVKNTLLRKALERIEGRDFSEMYPVLRGSSSIMIAETGNGPAKLITEFRRKLDKPVLKAAYVEETCYIGDDQLAALRDIKSKDQLLGDLIFLLQSPARNVISALQAGGGQKIAGLVKTLSEREQ
jgi:large subunit ribosomal protein L10